MKKKLLALLLSGAMIFALASCGPKAPVEPEKPSEPVVDQPTDVKTVKVGLLCIGDENDQGYTFNFIRG
ncbi:MAG: BMP family ABC transporter substrate-binding protein, partial [Oscillospiraceae bacterium]